MPTVVYIDSVLRVRFYIIRIVIYRQPCVLHIYWYTVHHPSGGGSSLCLVRGGYKCFQAVNIPPTGWLQKPLLSRVKVSETCVQPFQRYWGFGVFGDFGILEYFGVLGVLGCFGGVLGFWGVWGFWGVLGFRGVLGFLTHFVVYGGQGKKQILSSL